MLLEHADAKDTRDYEREDYIPATTFNDNKWFTAVSVPPVAVGMAGFGFYAYMTILLIHQLPFFNIAVPFLARHIGGAIMGVIEAGCRAVDLYGMIVNMRKKNEAIHEAVVKEYKAQYMSDHRAEVDAYMRTKEDEIDAEAQRIFNNVFKQLYYGCRYDKVYADVKQRFKEDFTSAGLTQYIADNQQAIDEAAKQRYGMDWYNVRGIFFKVRNVFLIATIWAFVARYATVMLAINPLLATSLWWYPAMVVAVTLSSSFAYSLYQYTNHMFNRLTCGRSYNDGEYNPEYEKANAAEKESDKLLFLCHATNYGVLTALAYHFLIASTWYNPILSISVGLAFGVITWLNMNAGLEYPGKDVNKLDYLPKLYTPKVRFFSYMGSFLNLAASFALYQTLQVSFDVFTPLMLSAGFSPAFVAITFTLCAACFAYTMWYATQMMLERAVMGYAYKEYVKYTQTGHIDEQVYVVSEQIPAGKSISAQSAKGHWYYLQSQLEDDSVPGDDAALAASAPRSDGVDNPFYPQGEIVSFQRHCAWAADRALAEKSGQMYDVDQPRLAVAAGKSM